MMKKITFSAFPYVDKYASHRTLFIIFKHLRQNYSQIKRSIHIRNLFINKVFFYSGIGILVNSYFNNNIFNKDG